MGSACLFFKVQPQNALLSDINSELVITFNSIKSNPIEIANRLSGQPLSKEYYYYLRGIDTAELDQYDITTRFIYLNRYCFNGLYRTNKQGKFNVPYSGIKTGNLPDKDELVAVSKALQNTEIICSDFEHILDSVQKDEFAYIDPPYALINKRIFNQYDPNSFGLNDMARIYNSLERIDMRGGKFVFSYAYSDDICTLYPKWKTEIVKTMRNIAGFCKNRKHSYEVIISNII